MWSAELTDLAQDNSCARKNGCCLVKQFVKYVGWFEVRVGDIHEADERSQKWLQTSIFGERVQRSGARAMALPKPTTERSLIRPVRTGVACRTIEGTRELTGVAQGRAGRLHRAVILSTNPAEDGHSRSVLHGPKGLILLNNSSRSSASYLRLTSSAAIARYRPPRRWSGPIPDWWIVARSPATYRPFRWNPES